MADGFQYRTVVTGLDVTEDARRLLEETIDHWQNAGGIATDIAWPDTTEARTIQSAAYDSIRKRTALGSQHSILATRRVSEALKSCAKHRERSQSPSKPSFTSPTVTYDPRCMTVFDDGTVSLATVEGRVRCDLKLPTEEDDFRQQFLDSTAWEVGERTLTVRDGTFRLHLGFKRPTPTQGTAEDGAVLEVDLGVENIAVTSTARFFSGKELQHVCREHARRRRSLEERGTRSAHLTARRLAGRERRYIEDTLHEVSLEIVNEAVSYDCSVIALEELKGIYEIVSNAEFAELWAYRRLCEYIGYKAEAHGIQVEYVDARNTSRRCSECGHCEKRNRRSRSHFECVNCGSTSNADYNASKNVAMRYVRDGQQSSSGRGTRRCVLKSGTASPNGEFTPYPDGSEEESADKSVA